MVSNSVGAVKVRQRLEAADRVFALHSNFWISGFISSVRSFASRVTVVGLILLFATSALAETISPREAIQHVGNSVSVQGVVSQVSRSSRGTTFVNFGGRYPNHIFYAVVFRDQAGRFPNIHSIEGKLVVVSGEVELYKGKPQIILRSPTQIELLQ